MLTKALCKNPYGLYTTKTSGMVRLIFILLLSILFSFTASAYSQKITLSEKNSSLIRIFKLIEKQTSYSFWYETRLLENVAPVTIQVKEASLEQVLELCLDNKPFVFAQVENTIIIRQKKSTGPQSSLLSPYNTITGKIVDLDKRPLSDVSVSIKGTAKGVYTNTEGLFVIEASAGDTLVFSYVGFRTREIILGEKTVLSITMEASMKALDELVVTGFGELSRKKDITGAVASLNAEDIESIPITSFDRAMQGKMAGVLVNGISGIPGGAVQVRVRGVGSINAGSAPLYIIDGIQVESGNLSRNYSSNVLGSLNPDDIETIDVLKDPATASIYGAQAANGVVVITTKRGKSGKTTISFKTQTGVSQVIRKLDVLSGPEIATLSLEAIANRDGENSSRYRNFLNDVLNGDPAAYPTYDWQDAVFRNGILQEYQLSLSGGNDKTRFFISGGFNKTKGHVINSDFSRGNLRVNLDHDLNSKLKIQTSLGVSSMTQNGVNGQGTFDNPNRTAFMMWPGNPIYNEDGSYADFQDYEGTLDNVVATTDYDINRTALNKLLGNISLTYQINKNLRFRSAYNLDYTLSSEQRFMDPRTRRGANVGYAENYSGFRTDWQTDQSLNYSTVINKDHQLSILAGVQYRHYTRNTMEATGENVPSYLLNNLGATGLPTSATSAYTTWKLGGIFSKLNYIWKNKYVITGTLRSDGSSRFGGDEQYGLFPAISAAWKIGEENFMAGSSFVSDLKLRAGYGITGNNDIGNFDARSLYSTSGDYQGLRGLAITQLGNLQLNWEENRSLNIGVDYGFWNGRIVGAIDYFISNRNKLLFNLPVPATNGVGSYRSNIGSLQNKGIEIELTSRNFVNGAFKWETSVNASFIKNSLTSLPSFVADGISFGESWGFVGEAFDQIFVPEYAGVNPEDGRPQWFDANKNITYVPADEDRIMAGSRIPTYFGGITNTFSYANIELRVFFQYSGGNKILNDDARLMSNSGSDLNRNQYSNQMRRWTQPGDITDVPKPYRGGSIDGASSGNIYSTRFVEDGSYLRLKELAVSYSLPKSVCSRLSLQNARLFISALNIWTKTSYTGFDPELVAVEDEGVYPQGKTMIAGIQVNF